MAVSAGELMTLAARQSAWMPMGRMSDGLPSEIADARPSGFLGRRFAATHADLRLPLRLTDWSDPHILLAMSRRGEDVPGDLIVGEESFVRWQKLDDASSSRDDYPALAEATMAGHPPGSSAGGERPKFGVLADGRHVLVKFATRSTTADPVATRWCDLLILEGLALDVVRSRGVAAAQTTLIDTPSHWFLESERFDRVGVRGRLAVLRLAAVHDDRADSWARAASSLMEHGRLTSEDARRLRWLDAFGALIGNTDRHQYNVLFLPDGRRCGSLRHSIRCQCAMRRRRMVKCRCASSSCRRSRQTRWTSGMTRETPRAHSGRTAATMRDSPMTRGRFAPATCD